jgi:predicted extracellular nuclease
MITNQKVGFLLLIPSIIMGLMIFSANSKIAFSAASHVVISEVLLGTTGAGENEFIEIYNPMETPVDISGWVISKKTANADVASQSALATIPTGTQVKGHGYYLIAHSSYSGTTPASLIYTENAVASNNTIYLKNSGGTVVDKLGLGSTNDAEGSSKGNPSTGSSAERKANASSTATTLTTGIDILMGNGEDTDNNSADFVNRTSPDPQNAQSVVEPLLTGQTPAPTSTPQVSASPSASGSATPVPSATVAPCVLPSATPTASPTVEPTVLPSSTPTPSATVIPTPSVIASPTNTPSPSATAKPTATPKEFARIITAKKTTVCSVTYQKIKLGYMTLKIPNIECKTVNND